MLLHKGFPLVPNCHRWRSNAGLLVGVAITQRPDLFRAAICLGPLLDMTRYHLFRFRSGVGR